MTGMTAKIPTNISIPQQANGAPITLSIGMIVKNEEKHLDNCLSALQKLRDNVNNELIIVDTGSTDRTKEIAKKYTDKVYDFKWIDDFAAARNFGLEKAKGEWFMFLDADEYTDENCEELIGFFNDKAKNSRYNSATVIVRSYYSSKSAEHGNFSALRIARLKEGVMFKGAVHEKLVHDVPVFYSSVTLHHYGYISDSDNNILKEKRNRNMPLLMKEYEKEPTNAGLVCLIIESCSDPSDERKWLDRLSELIDLPENRDSVNPALIKAVKFYLRENTVPMIFDTVQKYLSIKGNENNVCVLHIYIAEALAYYRSNDYSNALLCFEKYFDAYDKYINNELDIEDMTRVQVYGVSLTDYWSVLFDHAAICTALGMYDRTVRRLSRIDIDVISKYGDYLRRYITVCVDIAVKTKGLSALENIFEYVARLRDDDRDFLLREAGRIDLADKSDEEKMLSQISAGQKVTVRTKRDKPLYTLSIGMIVKNEEAHLDNCLSALQKLRDNVSSELIIVDTGSADRTKEIALRYTDKVYDFEWTDDFAAARNYGLKKASGEWFMFLDADEYMDADCEALIGFFKNSAANSAFNSAAYIVRNYYSKTGSGYGDFYAQRIVRLDKTAGFNGIIHEKLDVKEPMCLIAVPFHHYGYISDFDNNINAAKQSRNKPLLLKAFENDPENAQTACELIDACKEKEEKKKWVDILRRLVSLPKNKDMINLSYIKALEFYDNYRSAPEAIKTAEEYLSVDAGGDNACVLYVYIALAEAYGRIGDKEKALDCYERYFAAYERYVSGRLDISDTAKMPVFGCSETEYLSVVFDYADKCFSYDMYDTALQKLSALSMEKISIYSDCTVRYIFAYVKAAAGKADFSVMNALIGKPHLLNNDARLYLMKSLLSVYNSGEEMKKRIFEQTEIFEPIKEIYYPLRVITGFDGGRDISEDLAALSHGGGIINTQIPCLLYISVKTGFDLSESIDNARFSDISRIFSDTARQHKGLAHDLYVYQNVMPSDISIKSMLFYVTGFACSVTNIAASEDTDRQSIYDTFVTILSDYVLNIYNPQLLNPDDIGVLPELHQFGYYMAVALNAKNNGQTLEYVRALRSALACCEGMKPIVEYYIKSI